MIVLEQLRKSPSLPRPCALTIGSFDGVHLGHKKILNEARNLTGEKGTVAVLTFSNHPTHVLPGREPVLLLASKERKLKLLEQAGVDLVYCLPFTLDLAKQSYETFLEQLIEACPFEILVLGEGATLGNKKLGTEEKVSALGKKLGYKAYYVRKKESDGLISSRRIRACITSGKLKEAQALLGHPFALDWPTQNPRLALPPDGTYCVTINGRENQQIEIQNRSLKVSSASIDQPIEILFH